MPAADAPPPVFVIGNPRSGTTLLRLMLTCHPNIVIPPECGFALWWYDKYGGLPGARWREPQTVQECIRDILTSKKIEFWDLDPAALEAFVTGSHPQSYADVVSLVYRFYGRTRGRHAQRWGDKNNYYLDHILTIRRLFPGVLFIHIVRDVRDVACSYRDLAGAAPASRYAPSLAAEPQRAAESWVRNIGRIRQQFAALGWEGVLEIRYEDLVANPKGTLEQVCRFLREAFDAAMLDYPQANRENLLEPEEFLAWKAKTLEPPSAAEVGKYRAELAPADIAAIEAVADPLLRLYRY